MKEILWMEGVTKITNNDADRTDETDKIRSTSDIRVSNS